MYKKSKIVLVLILFGVGLFFTGNNKAEAATATCLSTHAGFCRAAGLHVGVTVGVNFRAIRTVLQNYYKKHSQVLGYSYMKYSGGHWYWVCGNMSIIKFSGVKAPCSPSWGGWSACSTTCGGGTQSRTQTCTGATSSKSCNTQPCCGSADKESYERTSEVEAAERCTVGDTVNNWVDNSGLAAAGGIAWTWNCNDGTADSNQCLAYKEGKCGYDDATSPSNPPYDTKDEACRFGSFNSVRLVGGVLYWKCGTGDTDKTVGDFFSNNPGNGSLVSVDYYGPKAGGVDCQCTPTYEYECKETGVYIGSCDNNCGGTIEENVQAIKTDTTCFLDTSMFINNTEYNTATGKNCTNKTINCAPCGVQDADGGSYHESN